MSRRAFSGWVRTYGVSRLELDMNRALMPISRQCVNEWARGRSYPSPERIPVVLKLSQGALRPEDVVRPRVRLRWGRRLGR